MKLGPYEIQNSLGAGGMGEVYRARDTRLGRDVAIKVSAQQFTERFEREARTIATLNHSNICTLYDVGPNYLVMEYIEGVEPKGPMPLDKVLGYARQIVDALEAAHDKGIVHRDLKPANITIRTDGTVKVLDFGLAKVAEPRPEGRTSDSPTLSPTLTIGATQMGMILGTAAYMSPEQARGESVDKRADIWAFGVVLYEMLTGERLFEGKTVSDTLAHVLIKEPDLSAVPAKVRRLLTRCLEKDPKKRLRDIGDAWELLEGVTDVQPQAKARATWLPLAVAILALAALAFVHFREAPREARVITATILPPENTTFDSNPPALSPDGRRIVFRARGVDGKTQLWIRPLDSPTAQSLPGTENATYPFWSPDGKSVAFFADGKLKRIEAAGGPALAIADAPQGQGGSWNSAGVIVFEPTVGSLQRVAASGGATSPASATTSSSHRFPWFLPDGRHFLFADQPQVGSSDVTLRIGALDSQEVKTLGPANSYAVYAVGYLLYVRQNTLMAQPFDERRLATSGEATPVAEQVRNTNVLGALGAFSVSRDGLLAFQVGSGPAIEQLTWFDRGGKRVATLGDSANFYSLEFSPDRKRLAAGRTGPQDTDLWIYEVARGVPQRVTFGRVANTGAVWSPDGRNIIYRSASRGSFDIFRKAADGTGNEELVYGDAALNAPTSWSPDGRFLLFHRIDPKTRYDIWVLPLEGTSAKPYAWLAATYNERWPQFSPDGRWVAYTYDESGAQEIYAALFPGPGGKRQISVGGGNFVRWRADGKEIFYARLDGTLMAADVSIKGTSIEVGEVRPLNIPVITTLLYKYDVSADGQRFLVATPREQQSSAPLTLVQNWTALLKK